MLEEFVKKCSLWEELTFEKFVKDCILGRDTTLGQRKSMRRKEWQRQCLMNSISLKP